MKSAKEIISELGMERHPEGGWYIQTFRDTQQRDGRAHSTAIYHLLENGERSHWHRIDAIEIWHYYAGAPIELKLCEKTDIQTHILGPDIGAGQRPQVIVPVHWWQSASSLGDWTLVGCTVAPGFEFENFELAPPGWSPE